MKKKQLKINIRTFVLGANHGQLLQAYGMKCLLENVFVGADVRHDLYHNHILKELIAYFRSLSFVKLVTLTICWIRLIKFSKPNSNRDITVFGADTIWMYNHPIARKDEFYFGSNRKSILVAFSPSNAGSPLSENENITNFIGKLDKISVRDIDTLNFVKSFNISNCEISCDPAFFIDKTF